MPQLLMRSRHTVLFLFAAILLFSGPGLGETLPAPAGPPILTISGNLEKTNVAGSAVFDLEMLMQLPRVSFNTTTIWTETNIEFTGVSLKVLLEELGAVGTVLGATAINDYRVEIPFSDAVEKGPIVAYHMNGAEMSLRNKGPLWIVYPYDSDPAYRTEVIYSRSIWQLDRIEIRN